MRPVLKKLTYSTLSLMTVVSLILSACAKKDDGGGGGGAPAPAPATGTVATTPAPCSGSACYTQNGGGNFVLPNPQGYAYGNNNGYCGCPLGQRPVYNQTWGYACVSTNLLTYNAYLGYNYYSLYQAQNTIPLNMQPIHYNPLQYGGNTNCFTNIAASCDVRAATPCTQGGVCRPIGGGSSIGVCTAGEGVDNYYPNNPYNNPYGNNPNYPYYNPYYNGQQNGNCAYRQTSWGGIVYTCGSN